MKILKNYIFQSSWIKERENQMKEEIKEYIKRIKELEDEKEEFENKYLYAMNDVNRFKCDNEKLNAEIEELKTKHIEELKTKHREEIKRIMSLKNKKDKTLILNNIYDLIIDHVSNVRARDNDVPHA